MQTRIPEKIVQLEKCSPMLYLDHKVTSWGRMFCDIENKESYTSNYAVIDRNENINDIIKEVEEYYNSRNITPKIFYRHGSVALDVLRPYFIKQGYSIREFNMDLMIQDNIHRNEIVDRFDIWR